MFLIILLCIFTSFSQQGDNQAAECQKVYQRCFQTCLLGEFCFSPMCEMIACQVQNDFGSGYEYDSRYLYEDGEYDNVDQGGPQREIAHGGSQKEIDSGHHFVDSLHHDSLQDYVDNLNYNVEQGGPQKDIGQGGSQDDIDTGHHYVDSLHHDIHHYVDNLNYTTGKKIIYFCFYL